MRPLIERIEKFNDPLLPAEVAIKYKTISKNVFSFFRGTNHLFYEDLSKQTLPSSPPCWICGDLHLENFGTFKGDNRLVYFDLNDFDESIIAPVAWELVRVLTSMVIAFDSFKIRGEESMKFCRLFLKNYSRIVAAGKPRYIESKTATGVVKRFLRKVETRSEKELLEGRAKYKNGTLHLTGNEHRQLAIPPSLKESLIESFKPWMESNHAPPHHYRVLDVRFRLAGTGSLGVKRYVYLIEKAIDKHKHMLIDMKQALPSSLLPYVKIPQPVWQSEAQRIMSVQRIMQNISPAQLSTLNFRDDSYMMQELQPTKDRINFKLIKTNFKALCNVLEDMALITASAHLRGCGRKGTCFPEDLMLFGQEESWHNVLLEYAFSYGNKMKKYYEEFKKNYKNIKK